MEQSLSKDLNVKDEPKDDLKLLGLFVFLLACAIFFLFAFIPKAGTEPEDGPAIYQSIVVMMYILAAASVFGIGRQLLSLFFLRRNRDRQNRNDSDSIEQPTFSENSSLSEKLQELLRQKKQLTEAQFLSDRASSSSTAEQKEAIAAALELVSDGIDKLKMRIAVNRYEGWEKSALDDYLKISGVDYATGIGHDIKIAREGISFIVEEGKKLKREFSEFQAVRDYAEIVGAVVPRIERIVVVFDDLLQAVNNAHSQGKVLRALKDVTHISTAADVPLLLPESGFADSVRILQEFQAKPLALEIDFQSERIKALQEIVRKDGDRK